RQAKQRPALEIEADAVLGRAALDGRVLRLARERTQIDPRKTVPHGPAALEPAAVISRERRAKDLVPRDDRAGAALEAIDIERRFDANALQRGDVRAPEEFRLLDRYFFLTRMRRRALNRRQRLLSLCLANDGGEGSHRRIGEELRDVERDPEEVAHLRDQAD